MEPAGSSREMRSTRFMGKKTVGRPTRSPSGSLICRIKWSKEFKSMPRTVIPEGLMASNSPQTFSLGVCRLTTTIECGSMRDDHECSSTGYRNSVRSGAKCPEFAGKYAWCAILIEEMRAPNSRLFPRQAVGEVQNHHHEARHNNEARKPA